jgi:large subunit ribosomal protein L30
MMAVSKKQLRIILRRSPIGHPDQLRRVLLALGLRRIRQWVVRPDHPTVRGMVRKVHHLVEVTAA